MSEPAESRMDGVLAGSFSRDLDHPVDDGFSASVVRRIRRRQWVRRTLLGTAAVVGGLVALAPAWGLVAAAGLDLEMLVAQWSAVRVPSISGQAASAGALAIMALMFARFLEG